MGRYRVVQKSLRIRASLLVPCISDCRIPIHDSQERPVLLVQIENLRHGFSSFIHLALRIVGRRAMTSLQLLPIAIYYTASSIYTNKWTIRPSKRRSRVGDVNPPQTPDAETVLSSLELGRPTGRTC
jgi:hypothetical protein